MIVASKPVNIGDIIFNDIDSNPYLNKIYESIVYNYTASIFRFIDMQLKEINIDDALRFADILSKSTHKNKSEKHKIWAQEIVSLLKSTYPENLTITEYYNSVLLSIENFRGLHIANSKFQGHSLLDKFHTEFSKEFLSIPADKDKQFFRSQKNVYDKLTAPYFSYSGPTSMGKSFIMRMFIKEKIIKGESLNFAIIVPSKALINEVSNKIYDDLQGLLSLKNYKVVTSPGAAALEGEHNFIFVLTPERLLYLLIGYEDININYLFMDEAHKISSNDKRSPFYYQVVDMLANMKEKPHIVFASPNIPNPEIYLKLVPGISEERKNEKLATNFSPVSQIKYIVDFKTGKIKAYDSYGNKPISMIELDIDKNQPFVQFVAQTGNDSQKIIYCSSTDKAVKQAIAFAENIISPNDTVLNTLAKDIKNEIHGDYYLAECITKGVAYHIGYLPSSIRMRIEDAFKDGLIHAVFCTSTLLEGVNLPAANLFITSYRNGNRNMDLVDFKNLIGRVGRIEFNLYANVYLVRLADDDLTEKGYENLLKADVPQQSLSVIESLTDKQKQIIVNSLKFGIVELDKNIETTDDVYQLMRKFAIILLNDIVRGNNSFVKQTFAPYLQNGIEKQIKVASEKFKSPPDDDINISIDQKDNLTNEIAKGLKYPRVYTDGSCNYDELMVFLEKLCNIFKWEKYEKKTLGYTNSNNVHSNLRWYGVIISQWIEGNGLQYIISKSIEYKRKNPSNALWHNYKRFDYDHSLLAHRNIVISQTLEAIERIVLFSISNYFLKFSEAYKKHHGIVGAMSNDLYEYVEYGTTNPLSIMFQRHEFSREAAEFIRKNANKYVVMHETPKLRRSIATCGNISIENEVRNVMFNSPELFVY